MRVCMILEGCYPYVVGGVSSWAHQYIKAMKDVEFVLWCVGAESCDRGRFKYELPENVVEVQEVFLDDAMKLRADKKRHISLREEEKEALEKLLLGESLEWEVLFHLFHDRQLNPIQLLMSYDFLKIILRIGEQKYRYAPFADLFHTLRSMLLPELYLMTTRIPEADIYHSTATGYSGILGSMGKWKYNKPFILTEHGIYTREREEELLRAKWVVQDFKQQWTELFYVFSDCAYQRADRITSLFHRASLIQGELGADKEKLRVLANGVHYHRFAKIPMKTRTDDWVDIGAVVRIAKIKDVKTLIYGFAELKADFPNARLHILGDVDDEEYFEECKNLIVQLKIQDIIFTGVVDVVKYMEKLDFTVLSSISEGQPLSILESFAAKRPCVATDVGCCRELLEGAAGDELGEAGILVPPMNKEELSRGLYRLCSDTALREKMGETGQRRAELFYTHTMSMERYAKLYEEVSLIGGNRI